MVKWLLRLPRTIFVTLVLGIAMLFMFIKDPPHTICRTQLDTFKSRQTGIIYKNPKLEIQKKPIMFLLIQECKNNSIPGSCYGLFSKIKKLMYDFKIVSYDCRKHFSSLSTVKNILFTVYRLMIHLAWGDKPSSTRYADKLNWLSNVDISLFCTIKKNIRDIYGNQSLLNLENTTFKQLPGSEGMSEVAIRELAIVSLVCSSYSTL